MDQDAFYHTEVEAICRKHRRIQNFAFEEFPLFQTSVPSVLLWSVHSGPYFGFLDEGERDYIFIQAQSHKDGKFVRSILERPLCWGPFSASPGRRPPVPWTSVLVVTPPTATRWQQTPCWRPCPSPSMCSKARVNFTCERRVVCRL